MWEYSSRKWCSTDQTYFQPARSQATASSSSRIRRACSAPSGSASISWRGTCACTNSPNSMLDPTVPYYNAAKPHKTMPLRGRASDRRERLVQAVEESIGPDHWSQIMAIEIRAQRGLDVDEQQHHVLPR